jgi:hypothetical protein
VEERDVASEGYDLPPLLSMDDFQVWADVEPPKGTVYNYPIRPWHNSLESITGIRRHPTSRHRCMPVRFIRRCWRRSMPASRTRR